MDASIAPITKNEPKQPPPPCVMWLFQQPCVRIWPRFRNHLRFAPLSRVRRLRGGRFEAGFSNGVGSLLRNGRAQSCACLSPYFMSLLLHKVGSPIYISISHVFFIFLEPDQFKVNYNYNDHGHYNRKISVSLDKVKHIPSQWRGCCQTTRRRRKTFK
jgi:hypothetical protein